jgi:uncharacterized membrane protein
VPTQDILAGVPALPTANLHPTIRRIHLADIGDALREGVADFRANPTHLIFLCLIYPIMGLVLGRMASGSDALPLVYPLVGGFALIGPLAAVGLYELSRRRERGLAVSISNAFDVFRSRRIAAILGLGAVFVAILAAWMVAAQLVFDATMPADSAGSIGDFVSAIFTTYAGQRLIMVGTLVGFVFAVVALTIGVVSFPLLVDREVAPTAMEQVVTAVQISVRATLANPIPIAAWGLVVAVSLCIGAATLLVGLAVLMPVLGHGTWHLYRKLIVA